MIGKAKRTHDCLGAETHTSHARTDVNLFDGVFGACFRQKSHYEFHADIFEQFCVALLRCQNAQIVCSTLRCNVVEQDHRVGGGSQIVQNETNIFSMNFSKHFYNYYHLHIFYVDDMLYFAKN